MSQPRSRPSEVSAAVFWRWVWTSILPALGYLLIIAGFVVIGIAWWGISRTPIVAKQLPYLASGGLAGIGLITLGGRYLVIQDIRKQSDRIDRMERMIDELHGILLSSPELASDDTADTVVYGRAALGIAPALATSNGQVVALHGGRRFHRPGCRMVVGKPEVEAVDHEAIAQRGLAPCSICEPIDVTAST
jgi:hypothetical protein